MVSPPEPREKNDVAPPLEWRRHFYDRDDPAAIVAAVLAGVGAIATLAWSVFNLDRASTHPSIVVALSGLFLMFCAGTLAYLGRSGALPSRRGRVSIRDGITYVNAGADWHRWTATAITILGVVMLGIGLITADRVGVIQFSNHRRFPAFVAAFLFLIVYTFWMLAKVPLGRRLEFSPHGFAGQNDSLVALIPWDSILEVNVHRGSSAMRPFGIGKRAEIVFTTTEGADVPEGPFGEEDRPYPIGLLDFDVDEDTLLNVIRAAQSHPEVRQLLGREEGAFLFEGPPPEVREGMRRTHVWLPWEQRIQEALDSEVSAEPGGQPPVHSED